MRVKFDDSELEGTKYLGEGEFVCTITKLDHKQSKSGKAMLEAEFSDSSGRTTRDWFMLEGNKFKLAALAKATGIDNAYLQSGDFDTSTLQGRKVNVQRHKKGEEMWDGKMVPRYENHYTAAPGNPVHQDEIPF